MLFSYQQATHYPATCDKVNSVSLQTPLRERHEKNACCGSTRTWQYLNYRLVRAALLKVYETLQNHGDQSVSSCDQKRNPQAQAVSLAKVRKGSSSVGLLLCNGL